MSQHRVFFFKNPPETTFFLKQKGWIEDFFLISSFLANLAWSRSHRDELVNRLAMLDFRSMQSSYEIIKENWYKLIIRVQ